MRQDDFVSSTRGEGARLELENTTPLGEPGLPRAVAFLERAASVGLALVLLLSAAFAIVAANTTSAALQDLRTANALNAAYQEARYDVAVEESLERKERAEPSAVTRADYRAVQAALAVAMRKIDADSDPVDRVRAAILRAHREYVTRSYGMPDTLGAHPSTAVGLERERTDPFFALVEKSVSARAARQRALTDQTFERLRRLQRDIITFAIILAVLRVVCFGVYIAILVIYKRRLAEAHRTQVSQLQEAARVDHLTGIGNHRAFKEVFRRAVSRASHSGETLTLALLDIDEMKLINDQSGHMHGDRVLQSFGRLLRVLSSESRPFRLGGDEFGVLLPNISPEKARSIVERLRLRAENTLSGATFSVGSASLTGPLCDEKTLHGQADAALYAAKRAGRNRSVIFDATVDEQWMVSPAKVRSLRNLIAADDMSIVFQPIWDVATGTILAYEALARPEWAGPQDVFDLAERVGRAHEIDAVCRRAALRRASELPEGVLLFLNVSPRSFEHGHLDPPHFAADVAAAGLPPSRVVVEITERSVVPVDVIKKVAKDMQRLGFRLALDDTGAGNAGLELLSQLCFDFVKIDRSIIVKAMTDRSAMGVMAGVIAIAKETGAYIIAEGIEDIRLLDFVCGYGWGEFNRRGVQGFLLRRPSPTMVAAGDVNDVQSILRQGIQKLSSAREGSPSALCATLPDGTASSVLAHVAAAERATPTRCLD
jgi:diguanylate cyclase (GGDEF)-like protein